MGPGLFPSHQAGSCVSKALHWMFQGVRYIRCFSWPRGDLYGGHGVSATAQLDLQQQNSLRCSVIQLYFCRVGRLLESVMVGACLGMSIDSCFRAATTPASPPNDCFSTNLWAFQYAHPHADASTCLAEAGFSAAAARSTSVA